MSPCLNSDFRPPFVCARRRAFSLIEILVVVALLSVIIIGLMLMFSQVQKAFRTGMTQTDVLEAGRVAGDMLDRELEQITPAYQSGTNFYAQVPYAAGTYDTPFVQPLPGSTLDRMNLIHDLFFVAKRNQDWVAIGYFVRMNYQTNSLLSLSPLGVGTLYRFETNATPLSGRHVTNLFNEFNLARFDERLATKVVDGVVHFKVRAFDTNGIRIDRLWVANRPGVTNLNASYLNYTANQLGGEVEQYEFRSNAVPAAVELEMGLLEDKVWQRFQGLPAFGPRPTAQEKYLADQAGRVHLFRSRVTIRNVDPVAYQ